ncbi:MAG: hypothetical protein GY940_15575 [bacterium]|nr:hypothetical protein [bacterium]
MLILITISIGLWAQSGDDTVVFRFNKQDHRVTVQPSATGTGETDILLTVAGEPPVNLSAGLAGKNLSPVVTLSPNEKRYLVSWFQFRVGDMQLCLYDSATGINRLLPLNRFKSVFPVRAVFYDGLPYLLLFKGNNTGNTDIFYYHLETNRVKNITASPDSDQEWEIFDEENRVFIETKTLHHQNRYRLKKNNLKIKRTKHVTIERERPDTSLLGEPQKVNEVVGFGDSITWGLIRMDINNKEDYTHPEWAYLKQLEQMMAFDYGPITTVNLGVPGNHTWQAIARLSRDMTGVRGYFCILMLGTNDVARGKFDVDETIENLEFLVEVFRDVYFMYPVITAIPPQKDEERGLVGVQAHKVNTELLNPRIIESANRLGVPYIDAYTAFFTSSYYWEDLLEAYRGNHPSPLGHHVMAELFKEKILAAPPTPPRNIAEFNRSPSSVTFHWDSNQEFDFSHYRIQFGYSPNALNRSVTTAETFHRFIPFPLASPFDAKIYFRIQSVDLSGNAGNFSRIQSFKFD